MAPMSETTAWCSSVRALGSPSLQPTAHSESRGPPCQEGRNDPHIFTVRPTPALQTPPPPTPAEGKVEATPPGGGRAQSHPARWGQRAFGVIWNIIQASQPRGPNPGSSD